MGNYRLSYNPQFRGNQTHCRLHRLYSLDPAEQLHFVNLIPEISEHWIDVSAAGWLLIFGMGFQQNDFTGRDFWLAHYIERYAALYDLYSH